MSYIEEALLKGLGLIGKKGVFTLEVQHDDWCGIFTNGVCTCDPIVCEPIERKSPPVTKPQA